MLNVLPSSHNEPHCDKNNASHDSVIQQCYSVWVCKVYQQENYKLGA